MSELNKRLEPDETAAAAEQEGVAETTVVESWGRRRLSLKNMLVAFIILCWGVPVLVIFISFYNLNRNNMTEKTQGLMKNDLTNSAALLAERINGYITDSKRLSYQRELERVYRAYEEGWKGKTTLYADIKGIIEKSFFYNPDYKMSVFFMTKEPDYLIPYTDDERYSEPVKQEAEKISAGGSYSAHPVIIGDRFYIIRNLYSITTLKQYGTLVLEINTNRLTRDVSSKKFTNGMIFSFDDSKKNVETDPDHFKDVWERLGEDIINSQSSLKIGEALTMQEAKEKKYEGYVIHRRENDYILHTVLLVPADILYSDFNIMKVLTLCVLVVLIPVLIFAGYFIRRHVTGPIDTLVRASRDIRGGDIGVQIDGSRKIMPNREFAFLMVSFNRMSAKIKYLFDYAYNEQLARKDAQIIALQSQINPHFLNNTLEMMNWQARIAGDIGVSKMIEALSTLLSYSMDRSNRRLISLAEEIRCADAYLYIISMRFGQRLLVKKEIDESLLQRKAPRLILQPLLENAVVHGVEKSRRGTIWLKAFRRGNNLYLQVLNTGNEISPKEEERIRKYLSGEEKDKENEEHVSLGIRNVNERIRLIYGTQYGLTIRRGEKGVTEATIIIPYQER